MTNKSFNTKSIYKISIESAETENKDNFGSQSNLTLNLYL